MLIVLSCDKCITRTGVRLMQNTEKSCAFFIAFTIIVYRLAFQKVI